MLVVVQRIILDAQTHSFSKLHRISIVWDDQRLLSVLLPYFLCCFINLFVREIWNKKGTEHCTSLSTPVHRIRQLFDGARKLCIKTTPHTENAFPLDRPSSCVYCQPYIHIGPEICPVDPPECDIRKCAGVPIEIFGFNGKLDEGLQCTVSQAGLEKRKQLKAVLFKEDLRHADNLR